MSRKQGELFARMSLDYADHPKIAALSDGAFRAHVEMILYCHRMKTAGVIDLGAWAPEQIQELEDNGLIRDGRLPDLHLYPRGGHDGRPRIPTAIRRKVYARDGGACVFCGATQRLSLDHIKRYRDGGGDTEENLRVLCLPCNQRRG